MDFTEFLTNHTVVLDGAMSTPLERLGADTNNDLWTAKALIDNEELVYEVHKMYFEAGADLIITDTYQANVQAFEKVGYSEKEARNLIKKAVKIAQKARDDYENKTGKHNYIAGTIGPYGAYLANGSEYRGDYELSTKEYQQFHLPRIEELATTGVDILAIETQPKLDEVLAILELLKEKYPQQKVYVSYTLSDDDTISDGTPLPRAIHALEDYLQVIAVGINCVKLELVEPALKNMKEITDKHLIVYPNSSAVYDPKSKTWSQPKTSATFEELIPNWYEAGARIIGGCCTTGPKEIKTVADFIKRNK
ncbi:homocysteine S-methyltransferase [Ligilactobacillus salivarius]|uniref:S-methylmethionine:homocysteine methyltransferase n=2 Tax=Ligilactobacillus salivarius TaxID=1624 RepID=V6DL26_9LACO|nr:homocysteine S-methyltransferase [Ligilactobacillus salivarius]CDK35457.1 Homocysteine S-methyltransferase [Ligilactobacillus salivarius cp400]ARU18557.1 homocysteine S-methyltransferase [Ligilactobacillus salivarius]QXL49409.1 homocysteine S-methyltransferase [Ligilactobacillus salivarius]UXI84795.1 homocysteine S-methyltransferase [Ligilactobacillus salivarius]WII28514.1 homocysteine S-methyltransferase [Ligilactobacillus salivarius]